MRITSLESTPFSTVRYLAAASGGGTATLSLPILRGRVDALPTSLDALVVASDLQGIELGGARRLLGEALADELGRLAGDGQLPPLERVGVLLAGDLYSAPNADRRGATGDVRAVWRALAARCRFVAGVAGNHDTFGDRDDEARFRRELGVHLLDGDVAELDTLRIGGVGGIIGDPHKPARRDEREFVRALRGVLAERPPVVVLHHGPDAERGALRGHEAVRHALDRSGELLVVCGHVHWRTPLADVRGGAQALNVDGRVVVLTA